jgi:hypothetical protein
MISVKTLAEVLNCVDHVGYFIFVVETIENVFFWLAAKEVQK